MLSIKQSVSFYLDFSSSLHLITEHMLILQTVKQHILRAVKKTFFQLVVFDHLFLLSLDLEQYIMIYLYYKFRSRHKQYCRNFLFSIRLVTLVVPFTMLLHQSMHHPLAFFSLPLNVHLVVFVCLIAVIV